MYILITMFCKDGWAVSVIEKVSKPTSLAVIQSIKGWREDHSAGPHTTRLQADIYLQYMSEA